MRLVALLFVALVAFQDPKPARDPWAGFPTGSWVVIETTGTAGDETKTKLERTIVRVEAAGAVHLEIAPEEKEPAIFFEDRATRAGVGIEEAAATTTKLRREDLEIGGKKFACDVTLYVLKDGGKPGETRTTVWRTRDAKVPYRELSREGPDTRPDRRTVQFGEGPPFALDTDIVRFEEVHKHGAATNTCRFKVVDFERKMTVGTQAIACVVEEGVIEEKLGGNTTRTTYKRWLTDAIPGRVLRLEVRGEVDGKPAVQISQAKSFKVK